MMPFQANAAAPVQLYGFRLQTLALALCGCFLLPPAPRRCLADPSGPFIWGSTVHAANAGWGRMIHLANGNWLLVSTLFPSRTTNTLQLKVSSDNARTWQAIAEVVEAGRKMDNGELIQLPNGTLLLSGRSLIDNQSYHLPVYQSTDNGSHWTPLSMIDANDNVIKGNHPSQGLWEPHFFLLPDGRVAVAYANEKHVLETPSYNQVCSLRVSEDKGATWGQETFLAAEPGGGGLRPGMPVVTRMLNGQYIEVSEVVGHRNADVYYKVSVDGVTWPPGIGTYIPLQHAGPWVTSLSDGRLVVSSCSNQVSYSNDYGQTWLRATPPAWDIGFGLTFPAVYQTAPNEIAVMNTNGGVYIRFGMLSPRQAWPGDYASNFGSGSDAGWTRYGGSFAVRDGAYVLNNATAKTTGKSLTGDEAWTDGTLEADIMLTSAGNAGLLLRTTNADYSTASADNVGPDACFGYYVGLEPGGNVVLGKEANDWTELRRQPASITLNTWHHVKVAARGSSLHIFVDDMTTPRITATDASCTHGQIGVRAHFTDARFRNVTYHSSRNH